MNKKLLLILLTVLVAAFGRPSTALAGPAVANLEQTAYRWRNDNGSETTATWKADENITISDVSLTEIIRIRFEVEENGGVNTTLTPQIEFSSDATSCTDGAWTTLDASTTAWRVTASANITDTEVTTDQLTTSALTFQAGQMYDTSNPGPAQSPLKSEQSEYEWSIRGDGASGSTTYRFRVTSAGTPLNTYTNCAQLATAAPSTSFTQNHYAWYVNPGTPSENVTDRWGDPDITEDNVITPVPVSNDPPNTTQELRLRVNITVDTMTIGANERWFKLQFRTGTDSDCSTGTWTDVGAAAGGEAFVYTSDTSVADDTALTAAKLTNTDRLETYSRVKPANTPTGTSATGEDIEFDFHIVGTNSISATRYLFRVYEANSDGTDKAVLDAYTNCPILHTEPSTSNLLRHGNIFSGESEQGFFWAD